MSWFYLPANFTNQRFIVCAKRAPIQSNGFAAHCATTYVTISRHFEMPEELPTFALAKEEERRLFLFLRF